jgi:hypothetical protein
MATTPSITVVAGTVAFSFTSGAFTVRNRSVTRREPSSRVQLIDDGTRLTPDDRDSRRWTWHACGRWA